MYLKLTNNSMESGELGMECKKCGPSIFDIAGVVIALAIATIVTIFFAQGAIPGMIILL